MITKGFEDLPIIKQCKILNISRSCAYYKPKEPDKTNDKALIMEIRNIYDEACFYGHIKVWKELERRGFKVGLKKVRKLREELELKAICPKYSRYRNRKCDNKFPYLLDGIVVTRPNQIWQSDITYVPTAEGFAYKTAIIDVFSRKILTYRLTATLQQASCISALTEALNKFPYPEIFNSDQGSQYASENFFKPLLDRQIQVSMDVKACTQEHPHL